MSILHKVRSYMLGTDYDEDLYEEDAYEEEEEYEEPPIRESRSRERDVTPYHHNRRGERERDSKVVNLPSSLGAEMKANVVICHPTVVDDATSICDHLRNNEICVVNLEGVERANAQRIADFLGGASYAISGEIQRISNEIFLIAPPFVGISSEMKEELKSSGLILPWISTAFK